MGATPHAPNMVPPAAFPWWKYGLLVYPPRRLTRRQKMYVVLYYLLLIASSGALVAFMVQLLGI
jgi:hypothetical protein